MNSSAKSVAIIGGGVIGLSLANRLARDGMAVTVFERGECGHESSWAAAGMLAAAAETGPGEETFFALARASRELWPRFARELESAAGMPIGYQSGQTLVVALDRASEQHIHETARHLKQFSEPIRILDRGEALSLEPTLAPETKAALLSPKDGQVDNRLLCDALLVACAKAGVVVFEQREVARLVTVDGRVTGVISGGETYSFDDVIVAAGAWSSSLLEWPGSARPPIKPIKGQIVVVEPVDVGPQHIVWGEGTYIVPREDGRVLIGATAEDVGFDQNVEQATLDDLLARAAKVVPALADAEIVDGWAGLRPATVDHLPMLGETEIRHLWAASGHFRNGVLLAPITAELMAKALQEGQNSAPLMPFAPGRFAKELA